MNMRDSDYDSFEKAKTYLLDYIRKNRDQGPVPMEIGGVGQENKDTGKQEDEQQPSKPERRKVG